MTEIDTRRGTLITTALASVSEVGYDMAAEISKDAWLG